MATNTNTYSNNAAGSNQLTAEQAEYYSRTLLDRLLPELFFAKYAEKNMGIPKNSGDTISWRRWNSLAVSTTALTEGVTPDGINLDVTKVSATVKQYGNWTKFTDKISMVGLDKTLTEVTQLMGENAGESIDTIIRDIMAAGTNVIYAGGRASRNLVQNADKITTAEVIKVRRQLKRNKVKPIETPMGKGYIWFIHTDVASDLMQDAKWEDANKYVDTKNLIEGLIGKYKGIYFVEADNAPKYAGAGASAADVYGNLIIGKGAYGIPDVEGSAKPEIIIHKAGEAGVADPLDQFNTVGWKALFTSIILNQLALVRYECSATV